MIRKIIILSLCVAVFAAPVFAQTVTVYPQGRSADITVIAGGYLNVYAPLNGIAKVFQQQGGPASNVPAMYAPVASGTVTGTEQVFGPYTTGGTFRVFAFAKAVYYSASPGTVATPCAIPGPGAHADTQFAPVTYNATGTIVSADIFAGLITSTQSTGATITLTLPTGTLLDAASNLAIGQGFYWRAINLSTSAANTVTVAAGSGNTIVGDTVTQASGLTTGHSTATWFSKKTAANTFVTYRY